MLFFAIVSFLMALFTFLQAVEEKSEMGRFLWAFYATVFLFVGLVLLGK